MIDEEHRQALRRRPLFTPLYALVAALVVALGVLGWAAVGLFQPPTTVVVVRHMEKALGDDPALSEAGAVRARQLAETLAAASVDAVYASQYRRAADTGAPLAERLSLPVQRYDAADTGALVADIRARHQSDTILVVGHSNTVPDIVAALSGRNVGPLAEDRYGDVFIVTIPRWGRTTVMRVFLAPANPEGTP